MPQPPLPLLFTAIGPLSVAGTGVGIQPEQSAMEAQAVTELEGLPSVPDAPGVIPGTLGWSGTVSSH